MSLTQIDTLIIRREGMKSSIKGQTKTISIQKYIIDKRLGDTILDTKVSNTISDENIGSVSSEISDHNHRSRSDYLIGIIQLSSNENRSLQTFNMQNAM